MVFELMRLTGRCDIYGGKYGTLWKGSGRDLRPDAQSCIDFLLNLRVRLKQTKKKKDKHTKIIFRCMELCIHIYAN